MTPREIIAKAAAGDDWREGEYRMGMGETRNADELNAGHRATADRIIEALHSAGYRILGPGEWDKEAVEKCARVAESAGNTWSNTRDPFQACQEAAVDEKCTEIATAIRALAEEKQG